MGDVSQHIRMVERVEARIKGVTGGKILATINLKERQKQDFPKRQSLDHLVNEWGEKREGSLGE